MEVLKNHYVDILDWEFEEFQVPIDSQNFY